MTATDNTPIENFWEGVEIIHTYTRAQAITDGQLVDVSETATEAGFLHPVAMTRGLHAEAVSWNKDNASYQDEEGRLWDVLTMAAYYARHGKGHERGVTATVLRIPNTRKATVPRKLEFLVTCGPGDTAEPVITLMLPGED